MKKLASILLAYVFTFACALAQQGTKTLDPNKTILKQVPDKAPEQIKIPEVFNAGELQIETAGQARTDNLEDFDKSMTFGLNYYLTKGAAAHVAVGLRDLNEQFIDRVEFGPVGRLTLWDWNAALLFGVGAEWQRITESKTSSYQEGMVTTTSRKDDWAVYAEAGPLFRVNKYLDFLVKVRGVRPIDGADREHIALIAAANIVIPTR